MLFHAAVGLIAVAAVLWSWAKLIEIGRRATCPGRWDQDGPDTSGER